MLCRVQDYLNRLQNEYKWIIFAVHMRDTKKFPEVPTRRKIQITYYLSALTANLIVNRCSQDSTYLVEDMVGLHNTDLLHTRVKFACSWTTGQQEASNCILSVH